MIERHRANQRMSQVVSCGAMVFLAGQVAHDTSADITGQTGQILDQIDELLELAGTGKSSLLAVTIWLADIREFQAMNAVWDAWIDPSNPPARACVEARLGRPELKVEIQATAMRQQPPSNNDSFAHFNQVNCK